MAQRNGVTVGNPIDLLFQRMDGRTLTIDGISGAFVYVPESTINSPYYGRRSEPSGLEWHPDAKGKRTEAYREQRRKLGDDWFSIVTNSDRLFEYVAKLRIDYDAIAREAAALG